MRLRKEAVREASGRLRALIGRYKIPILAASLGLLLLLWPGSAEKQETDAPGQTSERSLTEMEEKLETLLQRVDGAGEVRVMLTLADLGETVYQTDETIRDGGRERKTVLADKAPIAVQVRQPQFQGAVVVCEGAGRASVRLAVTEAVASLTGLSSDKITVIKMKGQ